jgi:hypothetical protein
MALTAANTGPSVNTVQDLTTALMSRYDVNKDSKLSSEEFSSLLGNLMGPSGVTGTGAVSATKLAGTTPITSLAAAGTYRHQLEGFDRNKMDNPSVQSVKYRFGRVAERYDVNAASSSMASAESLLNSMTSDLTAAGLTILGVSKDRIQMLDDSGRAAWFDVIRGAGASGPGWQWGLV